MGKELERKHREEEKAFAEKFREDAARYMQEEKDKEEQRRQAMLENASIIEMQMREKSSVVPSKFGHAQMSEVERAMNGTKLNVAKDLAAQEAIFRHNRLLLQMCEKTPGPDDEKRGGPRR